jgi:RNA polymerase sigma factor (sigma-70 family)
LPRFTTATPRRFIASPHAGSASTDTARIEDRLTASGTHRALAGAIACISAQDRDVLLLVAWAELSYEEVGLALEIPIGTVRSRLNRARRQVRAELDRLQPRALTEELCHERA